MKYTEIDGKRYEIKKCEDCPFMDNGDSGYCAHCNHPAKKDYIDLEYISYTSYKNPEGMIHKDCPLRDVQDQYHSMDEIINKMLRVQKGVGVLHEVKSCPFCGSTRIRERYLDDDCEEIEEWMVEEANSYVNEYGGELYNSIDEYREVNASYWQVYCPRCDVYVTSGKSIEDAWDKWNRRA